MTSNLILAVVFVTLVMILCWAIASRAYWKRRAARNEGVLLVCYSLGDEARSYRRVKLKRFPGKPKTAMGNVIAFLNNDGFRPINTASREQVFARGKSEWVKVFFLRKDGLVTEVEEPERF